MNTGGLVLAGGRSSRMGTAKAGLEWHGSTLLRRVSGIVGRVVGPVVVVGAPGQDLPEPGAGVETVHDARGGRGPLEGLAAGLGALAGRADAAFVASTDAPFLHPVFVRRVLSALAADSDADVILPVARGFPQPLAAAYRTSLAELVRELVGADRMKPAFLFEACRVVRLDEAALLADPALAAVDPELESLVNVNDPREYAAARARAAPAVRIEGLGDARAATLGEAARLAQADLSAASAWLNGERMAGDPELPLAAGDAVAFRRRGR